MNRYITYCLAAVALAFAAPAAHALDDAQIAAIVVTANQVDVDAGRLAAQRGSTATVRQFGELMVKDHTGVNDAAVALVTRLGVKPQESDTSRGLATGGAENLAKLQLLSGAAFDRAYVDHEVAYHEQVLQALDDVLIPNAQNDELEALLVKVRPAFVAHLEHARQLQAKLGAAR
jgi:putative membrane protein